MSQDNAGKVQRPFEGDNANDAAEFVNVKEEYKALEKKLRESEEKAQIAKNELEKIIRKNPQQLEELAKVIAILKGQQTETMLKYAQKYRLPLPLELNCQIFECLKVPIQKKFICGMGKGIYGIYREKVLTKSKRLRNPAQNGWNSSSTKALISFKNLCASDNSGGDRSVFAKKGFPISAELARKKDNYAGTILYYFEVTQLNEKTASHDCEYLVGLSDGNKCHRFSLGCTPNSYCMRDAGIYYWLSSAEPCQFELPNGDHGVPKRDGPGNVAGCGLLLDPENKVSIFFTLNGILLGGGQMPISSTVDCLYPTVEMRNVSLEANFGNERPNHSNTIFNFKYESNNLPKKHRESAESLTIFQIIRDFTVFTVDRILRPRTLRPSKDFGRKTNNSNVILDVAD